MKSKETLVVRAARLIEAGQASASTSQGRHRIEEMSIHTLGYAEPGYSGELVVVGNFNLITHWNESAHRTDVLDETPGRVAQDLERLGIELEWEDEWTVCDSCGKLIRTTGNCWSWKRAYWEHDGETECHECVRKDPEEYLQALEGNEESAATLELNLAEHGYTLVRDEYEHGFNPGQDADPHLIAEAMREQGVKRGRAEAERLGRVKDEFLANLSHEIRTPLNAILGWSQLLKPGQTSEAELTEGLEIITRNARTQAKLIDDLLDMSRIISGKMRLDVQRVDLPAVIAAAVEAVRPAAQAKRIKLQKVVDPIAGPITGDPGRLQQIVWNLLSNAVKFTPKGGNIQVVVERSNSHVELSVSDTGKGIAPEFLSHVFERFSQADNSTTMKSGGLGLGLAIVKSLAELHGGSVRAKSGGEGKGSTFIVSLPISVVHTLDPSENLQHPKTGRAALTLRTIDLKGVKVMVVDDEADAIGLVKRIIENYGATVQACTSGAECLACIASFRPDVLITDIGMPAMDGYTLIERLRAMPAEEGGKTPAVALTAFARSEDRQRAMLAGFDMHLAKPVEPGELVAVVSRLARRN